MSQVRKATQHTVTLERGEVTLLGEIPEHWTDYLGAVATMNTARGGWVSSVSRYGDENRLIVKCLKRHNRFGTVLAKGQVTFTLELIGTQTQSPHTETD